MATGGRANTHLPHKQSFFLIQSIKDAFKIVQFILKIFVTFFIKVLLVEF